MPIRSFIVTFLVLLSAWSSSDAQDLPEKILFKASDGLGLTADLYMKSEDKTKPFILLCHQAGWSRGEYLEIAPKLNEMGFNCMALDQRSGGKINDVVNESFGRAQSANQGTTFVDAEVDIVSAAKYAKENYARGKFILWGSSYSSALVLRIAGEHPELMDGVLSFAPGEYFARFGKPKVWISTSVAKAKCPIFITSAKNEYKNWASIFSSITAEGKTKFIPETNGNHGSRALWEKFDDHQAYWTATTSFLKQFK